MKLLKLVFKLSKEEIKRWPENWPELHDSGEIDVDDITLKFETDVVDPLMKHFVGDYDVLYPDGVTVEVVFKA